MDCIAEAKTLGDFFPSIQVLVGRVIRYLYWCSRYPVELVEVNAGWSGYHGYKETRVLSSKDPSVEPNVRYRLLILLLPKVSL